MASPGACIDAACLASRRDAPLSHDNLFHTLIGLEDLQTGVYDARLDAFAPCRGAPALTQVSDLSEAGR